MRRYASIEDTSVKQCLQINGQGDDISLDIVVGQVLDEEINRGMWIQSESWVDPCPPMIIPQTLLFPSITTDPESPRRENGPDLELRGKTLISLDFL